MLFKCTLWGWHCIITLCKVQGFSFVMQHLYVPLRVHFRSLAFLPPLFPSSSSLPPPLPTGTHHTAVCVYEFACLSVCWLVFVSYSTYAKVVFKYLCQWIALLATRRAKRDHCHINTLVLSILPSKILLTPLSLKLLSPAYLRVISLVTTTSAGVCSLCIPPQSTCTVPLKQSFPKRKGTSFILLT